LAFYLVDKFEGQYYHGYAPIICSLCNFRR